MGRVPGHGMGRLLGPPRLGGRAVPQATARRPYSNADSADDPASSVPRSAQPPPLRTPLCLWLQRPTVPLSDDAAEDCARLLALPPKPRHFLTTSRRLLRHFATCVAAPSDFPKPRATLCVAELESGATLVDVCRFVVDRVAGGQPPPDPPSPSAVVEALKGAAKAPPSSAAHIYVLLDCGKVRPAVDAAAVLRTALDFEPACQLPNVTLGIAANEELLLSLEAALVSEHCSVVRPGSNVKENDTLEVEHSSLGQRGAFLVKRGGRLHGYRNWCPHIGLPLNMFPDRFWNFDQQFLNCTTHGALFLPEDGLCVAGPCAGKSLRPVPLLQSAAGDILLPSPPMRSLLNSMDVV
eukprot:EG_transcript_14976